MDLGYHKLKMMIGYPTMAIHLNELSIHKSNYVYPSIKATFYNNQIMYIQKSFD